MAQTFSVEVQRTISVEVAVQADSAEEAAQYVNRQSFELPPRDQWNGHKDWCYYVRDSAGELVHEIES